MLSYIQTQFGQSIYEVGHSSDAVAGPVFSSPEGNLATLVFVKQFLGHTGMRTKIDAQGPQIEMFNGHFRILKWSYRTIFQAIFCGDIP
jgi:hypothetical protein